MRDVGVKDIAVIIGGVGSNKVKDYYGTGEKFGVEFTYIEQDYPKGIAHAIRLCKDFIGNEKFLVFLGDNIVQKSILKFAKNFEQSDSDALVLLCKVDNPTRFGIADVKDGKILQILEKPKNPPSNLAVTGIYFLSPIIFDIIDRLKPSWRNELEITDALQMLLDEKHKITYDMITEYWKDTGTPEDILHANRAILDNMQPYFYGIKEDGVLINGNVMINEGTSLKKGVKINGPVIIGKNCMIESDVKIGPNTSIGDNSKLAKCDISDSIIMANCSIECGIKIRNSIIAFNSIITLDEKNQDEKVFLLGEGTKVIL